MLIRVSLKFQFANNERNITFIEKMIGQTYFLLYPTKINLQFSPLRGEN